jgi:hypothetical protein
MVSTDCEYVFIQNHSLPFRRAECLEQTMGVLEDISPDYSNN